MIVIVDYGLGNLGSILNMFKKLGRVAVISNNPDIIASASKLIIPGVGAFDAGIASLKASGLLDQLNQRVLIDGIPILGICLGMQLMAKSSAEGSLSGLGWIDAEVVRFQPSLSSLKVPHMGWNVVHPVRNDPLLEDLPDASRFYFVHSYYVRCNNSDNVLLTSRYDIEFHSAFRHRNIWGVQFHPEKSHRFGMTILKNFSDRC